MMARKQSAKFFCENCGAEVPQNARVCRHCGKFFSSVRCPVCGTTGSPGKFANGCPTCGYAVGQGQKIDAPSQKESRASRKSKKALLDAIDAQNPRTSRRRNSDGTLPVWSFFVILAILALFVFSALKYIGTT
ncbi:MAG: zinc ribbon domain-containing protein [Treponema sp.]|uniref:zinc ribbon domain-containing protein n=1 Tax=Treponema sp. TaxID=166 RepID=UPI001B5C2325|nr:zinc ribbon domain-containing protein [Treponema sp.]MBP3772495.1 zinc ribbon domain-containing protein [Treponema sp.]MBQ9281026.1 zinc ribbon domain-containing protein [Treponema sp.]